MVCVTPNGIYAVKAALQVAIGGAPFTALKHAHTGSLSG